MADELRWVRFLENREADFGAGRKDLYAAGTEHQLRADRAARWVRLGAAIYVGPPADVRIGSIGLGVGLGPPPRRAPLLIHPPASESADGNAMVGSTAVAESGNGDLRGREIDDSGSGAKRPRGRPPRDRGQ